MKPGQRMSLKSKVGGVEAHLETISNEAMEMTAEKMGSIQDYKVELNVAATRISEDYGLMIAEKEEMVECLAKCRELDQEYESIFVASQQLDQNVIILVVAHT